MATHASWVHGNAVQVESPENFVSVGHRGWGSEFVLKKGRSSWFHIPLPTPVIVEDVRTTVQRLFVLFLAEHCEVTKMAVYDGAARVQETDNLYLSGDHRSGPDGANTIDLAEPHTVGLGMGITFFVQAQDAFDRDIEIRFITAAAGADFHT